MRKKSQLASLLCVSVAAVLVLASPAVQAQTFTWDGGGVNGDWSTAANWNPDGSPSDGGTWEIYEFGGALQLATNNNQAAGAGGWNVNDFEFLAGAGAFTLTDNGQGFDMLGAPNAAAPDGDADIINNSGNLQTISARLIHRPDFNTGLVFNTATADIDVTGIISQAGAGADTVRKTGPGTLTLTGNNSYTNDTVIMAGSLNIQSNTALGGTAGDTQVNDGATLQLQGGITVTGEPLSITGSGIGGALRNISGNNTWTGAVSATGTPFVRIVSDADKLTISGDITVTAGTLVLQGTGDGEVSGDILSAVPLIKSVTGAGTWILSGTNSHTTTTISNGTLQIGNGGTTGTLGSGAVTNNGALVFDRSNTLPVANDISGSGSVTQAGSGSVTLSGNNTYSGVTNVQSGELEVASNTALGSAAAGTTVTSGARVVLANGVTVASEGITLAGNGGNFFGALQADAGATASWDGPVTIGASARVGAQSGGTLDIGGAIGGGPTLEVSGQAGTGTVVISGTSNTYTGNTNIVRGILQIGANDALPTGTILNVDSSSAPEDSTFDLNGFDQTVAGLTRTGSGSGAGGSFVTNTGGSAGTLTVNNSANFTYDGTITNGANALNLVKDNTGTLTLTAANSYTGLTTVDEGVLNIQDDFSLGTTGGVTDLATGGTNATIQLQGGITVAEPLNVGNGGVTGTLQNVSGNNEWSGAITKSGVLTLLTDSGNFLVSGDIGGTANSINLRGVSTGEVSGDISSAFQVNKFDSGTWTLSGNNSYTSLTNVAAGVLRITSDTALGTTATGTTVADGAALHVENNITVTGEALTIAGHGISNTGALRNLSGNNTLTGAITMQSGVQSRIHSDAGLLTLTGGITSPGGNSLFLSGAGDGEESGAISGVFQLIKQGSGTWTLSGPNTYTTPTIVQDGTLVSQNGAIPDASDVSVSNSTLQIDVADDGSHTVTHRRHRHRSGCPLGWASTVRG